MSAIKEIAKNILPPFFISSVKKLLGKNAVEYFGNFSNWEDAVKLSGSYDNSTIFEKVKNARLKVLHGEASYERDSITFSKIQYFYPVLASLLFAATKQNNTLNILDFGGSLGTSYFQNKSVLKHLKIRWNIVEQAHFAKFGKEYIEDGTVFFYDSLKKCIEEARPSVFFISSVLQYIPDAYALLSRVRDARFNYLIFDRTTISETENDRITIQNVPRRIYKTNFPAHIFNEKKLLSFFEKEYLLLFDFPSIGDPIATDTGLARNKGYLFQKRS